MSTPDRNCIYCHPGKRLADLMIEIGPLEVSTLFLFRNQSYRGRCVIAFNRHVEEIFDLPVAEQHAFTADVARVARALKRGFDADKINYGIFGDTMPHLHLHAVPKFQHGPSWGKPFEMNPQPAKILTAAGYEATCELIRKHL